MKEVVNFELEVFNLSKVNPLVSRYKLFIAYPSEPANNYIFSEEVLVKLSDTIMGCPVVAGFMNEKDGSLLGGHEFDQALDKNNKVKRTPTPIPVGFAAYDIKPWFEEYKGKKYLTTFIYIWDGRFPELENLSERKIYQSMEVAVDEESDGKYKIVKEAFAIGLCLLENVNPAFRNSHIEKYSYDDMQTEIDQLKQEFEQFNSKYSDLDFTIPEKVKKNAQSGLDLYEEYNYNINSVDLAMARFIIKNTIATPEKTRSIHKYLNKKSIDNLEDITSKEFVTWQLYGGIMGKKWSTELVDSMDKQDEEKMTYFTDEKFSHPLEDIIDSNGDEEILNNPIQGENIATKEVEKVPIEFSLNSDQIREILRNALSEYKYQRNDYECNKYYVDCYDTEYVYVCDCEDDKAYRIRYNLTELIATIDIETKEQVIRGNFILVNNSTDKKDFANSKEQMKEFCNGIKYTKDEQEFCKYTYASCNDEYMFALDNETQKMSAIPYSADEEEKFVAKPEEAKKAKMSCFVSEEDDDEDEVFMCLKNSFSSNANVDPVAQQAMIEKEAEYNKKLAEAEVGFSELTEKLSKTEADMTVYMEENTKLKEFKVNIEKQNKEFAVETTLKDVISVLPQEEIDACRLSAENFSLENIDIWKNEVQAKAFKFSKGIVEKKPYIQIGLPIISDSKSKKGLWD